MCVASPATHLKWTLNDNERGRGHMACVYVCAIDQRMENKTEDNTIRL